MGGTSVGLVPVGTTVSPCSCLPFEADSVAVPFTASPDLEVAIRGRRSAPVSSKGVPVLTDDYAPTDALIVGGF